MNLNNIKLIIWDLDETFWRGTISEGTVELIKENVNLLKQSTDMGIINSICSKNSFDVVEKYLSSEGLWEYFVFPSISWDAKGVRVKKIIEDMKLRPDNVLFVDDNIQNLQEARFYCNKIMTALPDELAEVCAYVDCAEHTDEKHSRLSQYKLLEKKVHERSEYATNEAFLLSCDIRVSIDYECRHQIDRICDLIMRSNQLNYTKKRHAKSMILELIDSEEIKTGTVSVKDRFGDYGIVGFFAVKEGELIHYVFSCRTLGMRIEQYVYYTLGCPKLVVVGEVVSELNDHECPQWINRSDSIEKLTPKESIEKKILMKGPCDMSQIFSFINDSESIVTEFSYTNESGILIEGHNHTSQIVTAMREADSRKQEMLSKVDFFDKDQFMTSMASEKFDYIVLSMLTDGNLGVYQAKDGNGQVALCEKKYDLTQNENLRRYLGREIFTSNIEFTEENLKAFAENFTYVENDGSLTVSNLEFLRENIDKDTKLILLLGSEREYKKPCAASYQNRHIEHKIMNDKIRRWAENQNNVILLSFDDYIRTESDFLDTINHFVKRVYFSLAGDLVEIINSDRQERISAKGKASLYLAEMVRQMKVLKTKLCAIFKR